MTQLTLFVRNPSGDLVRAFSGTKHGDVASLKKGQIIWVVELRSVNNEGWAPSWSSFHTRAEARNFARERRDYGFKARVIPYKACLDTKSRVNRQLTGQRLDY